MCVYVYIYICVCFQLHVHMYMCVCMSHACVCLCMFMCMHDVYSTAPLGVGSTRGGVEAHAICMHNFQLTCQLMPGWYGFGEFVKLLKRQQTFVAKLAIVEERPAKDNAIRVFELSTLAGLVSDLKLPTSAESSMAPIHTVCIAPSSRDKDRMSIAD